MFLLHLSLCTLENSCIHFLSAMKAYFSYSLSSLLPTCIPDSGRPTCLSVPFGHLLLALGTLTLRVGLSRRQSPEVDTVGFPSVDSQYTFS